jgi:hypothetical protein
VLEHRGPSEVLQQVFYLLQFFPVLVQPSFNMLKKMKLQYLFYVFCVNLSDNRQD